MALQNQIFLNTRFRLVNMCLVNCFILKKLILFALQFWSSSSTLFFALFGFLNRTVFRIKGTGCSETSNSDCFEDDSSCAKNEDEASEPDFEFQQVKEGNNGVKPEEEEEEDTPKFCFKFQFQTYRENYEHIKSGYVPSTSSNKYEFLSEKGFSHYLEKPKVVTVKELYADPNGTLIDNEKIVNNGILSEKEFIEQVEEENSEDGIDKEEAKVKLELETLIDKSISDKGKAIQEVDNDIWRDRDILNDKEYVQFLSEEDLMASDSDSDSINSSHGFTSRFATSTSDRFLSDKEVDDTLKGIDVEKVESSDEELDLEDMSLQNLSTGYEPDDFGEDDSDIMEELQNMEESVSGNAKSVEEFEENSSSKQVNYEKPEEANSSAWESEDSNRLEILWEHQDLIEQLKMELKKVKATGLPTILEEDESPKIMEDLKPWKIDEKFQHEDRMGELHKFYRSYRERMRKFDILNYQKMYAIGFLQSKDPLQSISSHKTSAPALTSLLSQKFKRKKSGSDPMMNFLEELHSDLEMVYVGQMCLSWEILHWQYEKAIELWESDTHLVRRYNEVAGEFQQFQVLMQRFIENEPYEGPRVQNYIKNRCVLRNLLQVPVIREDSVKDKKGRRKGKDDDAITSDMLVEIMEESIRIFWRFVRADKDVHTVAQKSRKGTQIEPQDPSELELLTEVRTSLQKKEKKLKDILRSGNCILRKFQKQKEENSDNVLFFFSQVDMKLVSRVLNMSKISTDQLLWCHNKLSKINFASRKIQVEPSFLLFPCS